MRLHSLLLAFGLSQLAAAASDGNSTDYSNDLPTIDLGYAVYRASSYNQSYDAYIFSNIRFAAPPTGALRFGPPQPPLNDRSTIHDGSVGFSCPQALPSYFAFSGAAGPISEDCLFLDVIVPRKVLEGNYGDVPVLVWIYGGGYSIGSKTFHGDPITFLSLSPSPVVYVAPNYRLGAFGWIGGPTFTLSSGTIPNAGLYDQRLAFQWVQENIHLFHGSKNEVTIAGASAGAGSVFLHTTAYGGRGEALFNRAIAIGPSSYVQGGHSSAEEEFEYFAEVAGCSGKGVECLRSIPEEKLIQINNDITTTMPAPDTGYGPIIDGDLIPDAPTYLLAQGRFHKNITMLVSDDFDEGFIFTVNSSSTNRFEMSRFFPSITPSMLNQLMAFYPPPSDSTPYTTERARFAKIFADNIFDCSRYSLSAALPNATYNLRISIPPGLHGTWPTLLFRNLPGVEQVVNPEILRATRRFFMNFVVGGTPNELPASQGGNGQGVGPEQLVWPLFGSEGMGLDVLGSEIKVVSAVESKSLCEWWAKGLVLG